MARDVRGTGARIEAGDEERKAAWDGFTVPTKYWHVVDDGRIQCDMCPRACKLREGQRGVCFLRGRLQDQVVLTSYGRSSGFCVDPIEKKPLNHFLPGSSVLSFGTAGCNLACRFCQNWDISKSKEIDTLADAASPTEIVQAAQRLGCRSVAFTYNDPVIFHEYAIDVADVCHEAGINAVAVSAGYVCREPRGEFYSHIDAANIDLKAFSEDFYRHVCGGHLEAVKDTLRYIHQETSVWLEVTTLLIPGLNDSDKELNSLASWVASDLDSDVPLHFSAFHPDYKLAGLPPTPPGTLSRARRIALAAGLSHVYTGNVHDAEGSRTYCVACGQVVVERDWYTIRRYRLSDDGRCTSCGTQVAGVFDGPAGTWGARRLAVRLTPVVL
jgi:pyruvate formate lyase activating enzyme